MKYFSDHGIFITNIIPGGITDKNGRLKVGDRLLSVQSMVWNTEFLVFILELIYYV